ncbi:MAG: hypothetical protein ACERK9_00760 [Deltaproteobacteria bacterium]|jgi:hypothetical protein
MDTDKIVEKIIKWLSDPKGREMFKTIVYVVLPLFLLLAFRSAGRRRPAEKSSTAIEPKIRPAEKSSTAIEPKIRPASYDSPSATESLKETWSREQEKVERELREVFGREDSVLARAKREFNRSTAPQKARPAESPERNEKKTLQEELLKLFSRR